MVSVKLFDKYGNEIDHLTQWDINVTLKIYGFNYEIAPVCHFAKRYDKVAYTATSELSNGTVSVIVPNILLGEENPKCNPIKLYVFLYESELNTGRTLYEVDLPIVPKLRPLDYEYEDNREIIILSELKVRLESLVARTEETIGTKFDNLENSYHAKITEIKGEIAEDVNNLNRQIINSNTALISEIQQSKSQLNSEINESKEILSSDITNSRNTLEADIQNALDSMIHGIRDGSPKGVFSSVGDLENKPSGIYLLSNSNDVNNGYIYYWDGEHLSDRLLYYAGIVINNGSITYEKLAEEVKKRFGVFMDYILEADRWINGKQEVDISDTYTVTTKTVVNVEISTMANIQMLNDDCSAIYITTNEENDGELLAHYVGNKPTSDITVQLNIVETY